MRLALILLCLCVAGCGPRTVADLKAEGATGETHHTTKAPMEFAGCVIPAYDARLKVGMAHMRATTTGLEVIKTTEVMGRGVVVVGVIAIDADGTGSAVTGTATRDMGRTKNRVAEIEAAIRQCI